MAVDYVSAILNGWLPGRSFGNNAHRFSLGAAKFSGRTNQCEPEQPGSNCTQQLGRIRGNCGHGGGVVQDRRRHAPRSATFRNLRPSGSNVQSLAFATFQSKKALISGPSQGSREVLLNSGTRARPGFETADPPP